MTPFTLTDHLDAKKAGELSTLFDVGGIFGESSHLLHAYRQWHMSSQGSGPLRADLPLRGRCAPRCTPEWAYPLPRLALALHVSSVRDRAQRVVLVT